MFQCLKWNLYLNNNTNDPEDNNNSINNTEDKGNYLIKKNQNK